MNESFQGGREGEGGDRQQWGRGLEQEYIDERVECSGLADGPVEGFEEMHFHRRELLDGILVATQVLQDFQRGHSVLGVPELGRDPKRGEGQELVVVALDDEARGVLVQDGEREEQGRRREIEPRVAVHDEVEDQEPHLRVDLRLGGEVGQAVQRFFRLRELEVVVQLVIVVLADGRMVRLQFSLDEVRVFRLGIGNGPSLLQEQGQVWICGGRGRCRCRCRGGSSSSSSSGCIACISVSDYGVFQYGHSGKGRIE